MASKQAEVVVLGAGPAGYVCAIRLAQLGKKVTVIDRDELGGVCLNRGCIPSKALIYAGTMYEKMQNSNEMGISVKGAALDMKKMIAWKETVVKKLTGGVGGLLKAHGCEVISGDAKFTSATTLEVKTKAGTDTLTFKTCVVATGSRPTRLPGFDIDHEIVLDSTSALNQTTQPETMLCIGGGYIGLELGTFYAKIGTKVTVVEAGPGLLGGVDPELSNVVKKHLEKRGVELKIGVGVKSLAKSKTKKGNGAEVTFADGKKATYDKVLVTIGRTPNSDGIGLEKTGAKIDAKGFLVVDPARRTNVPSLYAIGDIAGQPLLAHKGSKEGIVAAEAIAGKKTVYDVLGMPAVIFTDPEIATVGLTEAEAKAKGFTTQIGKFPFAANGRALSVMEPDGFVKMIGDAKTGRLLGVHIVGAEASNLIAEATLAIEMGALVEDVALTVHAHPTLPETMMEAAEATLGHAIHIFQRKAPAAPGASAHA
jgi:dihydrolipoamide dehydrogenase